MKNTFIATFAIGLATTAVLWSSELMAQSSMQCGWQNGRWICVPIMEQLSVIGERKWCLRQTQPPGTPDILHCQYDKRRDCEEYMGPIGRAAGMSCQRSPDYDDD
jgi:hypothetical protein